MSAAIGSYATIGNDAPRRPAPHGAGRLAQLKARYFATPGTSLLTIVLGLMTAWAVVSFVRWGIIDAVWYDPTAEACKTASGACWAVITEKYRVILLGTYPYDEQWRSALIIAIWVVWAVLTAFRLFPLRLRLAGWLAVFVVTLVLMRGGLFGLSYVGTDAWGGLPLTFLVFGGTIAFGIPLAILLALGRRSPFPVVRFVSIATIEGVRGIPLLVVLFFGTLILPLFLPPQLDVDKLVRAEIGMVIFFAAYAAEVIRGGLQAVADGQDEAAKALGMGYWLRMRKIVLPQAVAIAIPALFNDIIRAFKNTTYFAILGLFDVLGATKVALDDPAWVRYGLEGYLFVFLLYFLICSGLSLYGRSLEQDHARRTRRAEQ